MLGMFIFAAVIFTLTVGLFFGVMFTIEIENGKVRCFVVILIAIAIGCLMSGMICLESKGDETRWNNGICEQCGGDYNLASTSHHRNGGDDFYWSCDDCGHVIKTHRNMK